MAKFIRNNQGVLTETPGLVESTGTPDAGKIVETASDGRLDMSLMPEGIGQASTTMIASENLLAGDFVNIWSNNGTQNCRKAIATGVATQAHGYVNKNVSSGQTATVFFMDFNTGLTGLTPGTAQFLSASQAGKTASTAAGLTTGQISQRLGIATATNKISVTIQEPIVVA